LQLGLPFNSPESAQGGPDTRYSDGHQRPIRYQGFTETTNQRIARLALGTIRFWGGCWLAYLSGGIRNGCWCVWGLRLFSSLLMVLGGGLLLMGNTDKGKRKGDRPNDRPDIHANNTVTPN
jgi:hypothetical protein